MYHSIQCYLRISFKRFKLAGTENLTEYGSLKTEINQNYVESGILQHLNKQQIDFLAFVCQVSEGHLQFEYVQSRIPRK